MALILQALKIHMHCVVKQLVSWNILLGSEWNISLRPIFKASMELLNVLAEKQDELLDQVEEFFTLRLKNILP